MLVWTRSAGQDLRGNVRDLGDELLHYGVAEALEIPRRNQKGAGTADDLIAKMLLQPRLDGQDRQAVDGDAQGQGIVTGATGGPAAIVGAVSGDVDHLAVALKLPPRKPRHAEVDRPADRGAAAEDPPWHGVDGPRDGLRAAGNAPSLRAMA